ncbi:MAG: hypothetical protein JSV65_04600 [Armatimonadota bacterium]|nr:MAG: hypothetical protein JSV65_04600 [Armatimonadota bacterium]
MAGRRRTRAADGAFGCVARLIGCAAAGALGALGLAFLVAASARSTGSRVAIGAVMTLAAILIGVLVVRAHLGAREQRVPLGASLPAIREARCPNCGRSLEDQRVHMEGMSAVVRCPACDGAYRLEEEPKW